MENVEIVRRVYEGWSRGVEEMQRIWQATLSAWDDFRAEPDDFADCGDNVLVLNSIRGRGKGSGAEVSAQTATVWTLDDGRVVRLALYWDTALAAEAAGRQA